jgi:hypothetical protein
LKKINLLHIVSSRILENKIILKHRKIDHIVYSVLDLEQTMNDIESQLGIRPVFGGYHKTQGTKNALLDLDNGCYLEILSIDHDNKNIESPRWMGIDLISEPRITRWALKSDDIESDSQILKLYEHKMGSVYQGSRKTTTGETLAWKMILPLSSPDIELIPFMVDWSESAFHPTEKLQKGCFLKGIRFSCSAPDNPNQVFNELSISNTITINDTTEIAVTIEGPNGFITLK